jgi:transposase
MVAVPTIEEEDAKRPGREREKLVGERTRIINRLKSDPSFPPCLKIA